MFAGRIDPAAKGLGVLLRAMVMVDAPLDVYGDGWWLSAARSLTQRLGLSARVNFHGWASAGELAAAYRRATVVAVPSLWPEPFGIVGIEAMSNGRPVVASRVGGIEDWHGGDATGVLVPPGDVGRLAAALNGLLREPDRCRQLGAAGAARVEAKFTRTRYLQTMRDTYSRVLAGHP
jgi:glycosyltransferase involved in cell wall biosynthesis